MEPTTTATTAPAQVTPLTPTERRALRARAHGLKPVVWVADAGLTPSVLAEIDRALTTHELIKIQAAVDNRRVRAALLDAVCLALAASPVQVIGKVLVAWRPRPPESPTATAPGRPARRGPRRAKRTFQANA